MNPAFAHSAPDGMNFRTGNLRMNRGTRPRAQKQRVVIRSVFVNEDDGSVADEPLHGGNLFCRANARIGKNKTTRSMNPARLKIKFVATYSAGSSSPSFSVSLREKDGPCGCPSGGKGWSPCPFGPRYWPLFALPLLALLALLLLLLLPLFCAYCCCCA